MVRRDGLKKKTVSRDQSMYRHVGDVDGIYGMEFNIFKPIYQTISTMLCLHKGLSTTIMLEYRIEYGIIFLNHSKVNILYYFRDNGLGRLDGYMSHFLIFVKNVRM